MTAHRASRREIARVLAGVMSVSMVAAMPLFLVGGLAPQIKAQLGLGEAAFGAAFSGYFVLAVLFSHPLGRWMEGRSASRGLRLAALVSSASMLGMAVLAQSWWSFVGTVALGGMALTLAEPAGNVAVSKIVPISRQGLGFGIKQASFPSAGVLSGIAVPLLGLTLGWRWSLACAAGVAGLASLLPAGDAEAAHRATRRPSEPLETDVRHMLLLATAVAFGSAASGAYSAFMVSSAVEVGLTQGTGGVILAASTACAIPLRLTVGTIVDRPDRSPLRMAAGLATVGSIGYLLLASGSPTLFPVGAILAFASGWGWIGTFHFAIVRLNPRSPAAATGFAQTGTYAGALLSPFLFGSVVDRTSFQVGWTIVALSLLVAAAALLLARRAILGQHARGQGDDQPTVRPPSTE